MDVAARVLLAAGSLDVQHGRGGFWWADVVGGNGIFVSHLRRFMNIESTGVKGRRWFMNTRSRYGERNMTFPVGAAALRAGRGAVVGAVKAVFPRHVGYVSGGSRRQPAPETSQDVALSLRGWGSSARVAELPRQPGCVGAASPTPQDAA